MSTGVLSEVALRLVLQSTSIGLRTDITARYPDQTTRGERIVTACRAPIQVCIFDHEFLAGDRIILVHCAKLVGWFYRQWEHENYFEPVMTALLRKKTLSWRWGVYLSID